MTARSVEPPGRYLDLFRRDAARWVRPEGMAALSEVTARRVIGMLLQHAPLRAMAWFRFGSWAKHSGVRGVTGWTQRRIARLYGLEISPGADVGGGLYVPHPAGTTIAAARIGQDVSIISGVTLGARGTPAWPTIGDRVYIGAGARVLGGIVVGDDAVVGANAVVIDSVRPQATVVGVPARETARRQRP